MVKGLSLGHGRNSPGQKAHGQGQTPDVASAYGAAAVTGRSGGT
jgi:hypothetical protein